MWNLKRNDTNELTDKRLADLENELTVAGGRGGRESQGLWDGRVHTAVIKLDHQQGPPIVGQPGWEGAWGRRDTCTCMAESLRRSPETITTVLTCYTLIQNKSLR